MVAHVSSASDTSESVSMTEKIIEDNEVSEVESILGGIHWQRTSEALDVSSQQLQFISIITSSNACILTFTKFIAIMLHVHHVLLKVRILMNFT